MKSPTVEERVYRAIRRHMMPYRIWPDPKPTILKAIARALKQPPPKVGE